MRCSSPSADFLLRSDPRGKKGKADKAKVTKAAPKVAKKLAKASRSSSRGTTKASSRADLSRR